MKTITIKQWQLAALFLMLVTLFTACQKETQSTKPDPAPTARPRLVKLEQNAFSYMTFGYTTDGYLNRFKLVIDNLVSEAHLGYSTTKKLIGGTIDGYDMEFVYDGATLHKIYFTSATSDPFASDYSMEFFYENERVSKTITAVKQGANFIPSVKHTYQYYANGDMKTDVSYYLIALPDQYAQTERVEYEYDDKPNAIQMIDELSYILSLNKAAHNIKKVTRYDASDALDETKSYSLNYNSFGLPTTGVENTTYPNSPALNRNLTYSYQ